MSTIHWLGAGLSSAPGIRRLAKGPRPLVLWNRTLSKAEAAVAGLSTPPALRELTMAQLDTTVKAGDIVVSMLPATMHLSVAQLALARGAHFVSSSYVADDMRALHAKAAKAGVCLVNEVGLDPGLDHLMAHSLIHQYRQTEAPPAESKLHFRSYCGGFPLIPNAFRYKFSWSPLGVLRALKSPARSISGGEETVAQRPWQALSEYTAKFASGPETFQAYPNRDSLPFIADYGFDPKWQIEEFVRGTLRLNGWSAAWANLFEELDQLEGPAGEARLQALSDQLWRDHRYQSDEQDRVVLCVELEATAGGKRVWHRGYSMDAVGNDLGSAMARLVSYPVSLAVDSIAAGEIEPGVSAAPASPALLDKWFDKLAGLGETIHCVDYLS